eukprot:7608455-Prorocentrum_lima.AAC.1
MSAMNRASTLVMCERVRFTSSIVLLGEHCNQMAPPVMRRNPILMVAVEGALASKTATNEKEEEGSGG